MESGGDQFTGLAVAVKRWHGDLKFVGRFAIQMTKLSRIVISEWVAEVVKSRNNRRPDRNTVQDHVAHVCALSP